ncbi:MAG: SH3 domain-containing protein [Saprospiraceae bacterium]
MRLRHLIILLTFFLHLFACKDTNSSEAVGNETTTPSEEITNEEEEAIVAELPTYVYPWVDQLRIRDTPGTKGVVLGKLKENEPLEYLGEETVEQHETTLRGKTVKAPWIKVKTKSDITGWIFGGATTTQAPARDMSTSPFDDCYKKGAKRWRQDDNCFEAIAKKQFRNDRQFVRERNGAYLLTLLDGTFKVFDIKDATATEELLAYTYIFYLKEMGFFVLKRTFPERSDYLLVNDKTGKATAMSGIPKASPNRNFILTLDNQKDTSSIEIWELSDVGLNIVWERQLSEEQAFRPWWLDNKAIQLVTQSTDQPNKAADTSLILLDETGEWVYEDRNAAEI